jgi:hypothetical protein
VGWFAVWLFRVAQAVFLVNGADVPDEWWQSTEVAEYVVFGRGQLTWEWGTEALRSYVYPLPFIIVFYFLKITGLSSFPFLVWLLPRIMAATTCVGIDYLIARLARKHIFPHERAQTLSIVLSLSSWFTGFVGVRTQSNVAEAIALLCALDAKTFTGFLLSCGIGCAFRVTFAIPAIMLFYHRISDRCFTNAAFVEEDQMRKFQKELEAELRVFDEQDEVEDYANEFSNPSTLLGKLDAKFCPPLTQRQNLRSEKIKALIQHLIVTVVIGVATILGISLIDSVFYGRFTCSPLNFLVFNVVSGLSKLFGTHPLHWYVSSALPVMFLTLTPIAIGGYKSVSEANVPVAYSNRPHCAVLCARSKRFVVRLVEIIVFSTCIMSLLGHKEMRFLFFTVPLMVLIAAAAWSIDPVLWKKRKLISIGVVFLNFAVFIFFGSFWQVAPLSVASYMRSSKACDETKSLHALTHCFALPGESFFHGCTKEFLQNTCPVVQIKNLPDAGSESRRRETDFLSENGKIEKYQVVLPTASDMFLDNPLAFVEYVYEGKLSAASKASFGSDEKEKLFTKRVDACPQLGRRVHKPFRFVLYDCHEEVLKPFLERNLYGKVKTFFHTWLPLEDFHGKTMVLYEEQF